MHCRYCQGCASSTGGLQGRCVERLRRCNSVVERDPSEHDADVAVGEPQLIDALGPQV